MFRFVWPLRHDSFMRWLDRAARTCKVYAGDQILRDTILRERVQAETGNRAECDFVPECDGLNELQGYSRWVHVSRDIHVHYVLERYNGFFPVILDKEILAAVVYLVYKIPHELLHDDKAEAGHEHRDENKHRALPSGSIDERDEEEDGEEAKPQERESPLVVRGPSGRDLDHG